MNPIAIMQGRLSPAEIGRLQFFPLDWEAEFSKAKELGFDQIQWFLDRTKPGFDPVVDLWLNPEVLSKIDKARKVLPISSIDSGKYFWFGPESQRTLETFNRLLPVLSGRLSTGVVLVPLLKQTAPHTAGEKEETQRNLKTIAQAALPLSLRIALETEMPAAELVEYVDGFGLNNVGVGYDIGNATWLGFDGPTEIKTLDERIFEVHLKDAKKGVTPSVSLGEGDANLAGCFKALKAIAYKGVYTLQAWRGEDYLSDAKKQLATVKKYS